MYLMGPLLGADGVAVQRVHHRIATVLLGGVAGRQEHQDIALGRIPFQVSVKGSAVNFDVLDGGLLGRCQRGSVHDVGVGPRQRPSWRAVTRSTAS